MPRIPTPLTWKRRNFAVFEPCGMIDRLYAVAVSGLVSGPFAIYKSPHANGFTLVHLPYLDSSVKPREGGGRPPSVIPRASTGPLAVKTAQGDLSVHRG